MSNERTIASEGAFSASESRGVEAVDRAFMILNCCADSTDSLGLSAVAKRTGLYKSTVLRLMGSLRRAGLIEQLPDKSYRLGQGVMRLAAAYQRADSLEEKVRPVLRRLVDSTGESASLHRIDGDQRLCVLRENSRQGLRDHVVEGSRQPIKLGGASSQVLASIVDWKGTELPDHVLRGLPMCSIGQPNAGVFAVSMPVFNRWDQLEGALTISGPAVRLTKRKLTAIASLVVASACDVSRALGASDRAVTTLRRPCQGFGERLLTVPR